MSTKKYIPREELLGPALELEMRNHTRSQIAESLGVSKQKIDRILLSFKGDYLSYLSSKALIPKYYNENLPVEDINKDFYGLISKQDQPLTTEEMLYCAFYVSTGNSVEALKRSGLDTGLKVNESITKEIMDSNCLLRSEMLKRKANVQMEIRRVQQERQEYRDINRDRILEMHLEMIEQLREEGDPKNKSYIIKLLDQVNKMQGNYVQRVETSDISADDVLDGMLLRAKEAKPQELLEEDDNDYGDQ